MAMPRKRIILSKIVRTLFNSCLRLKSHYDVLEITPKASQKDVKTAYYKLSKLYHPDKSNDVVSAEKFRAITEAYEVLGNITLRKNYDREVELSEPMERFYKSRNFRSTPPTMKGKTPYYDYDTWLKSHYGNLFEEKKYHKEEILQRRRAQRNRHEKIVHNELTNTLLIMFCIISCIMLLMNDQDYDNVKSGKNNGNITSTDT